VYKALCDRNGGSWACLSQIAGRVATTAEEMPQEICRDEEIALPLHHQNK